MRTSRAIASDFQISHFLVSPIVFSILLSRFLLSFFLYVKNFVNLAAIFVLPKLELFFFPSFYHFVCTYVCVGFQQQ